MGGEKLHSTHPSHMLNIQIKCNTFQYVDREAEGIHEGSLYAYEQF